MLAVEGLLDLVMWTLLVWVVVLLVTVLLVVELLSLLSCLMLGMLLLLVVDEVFTLGLGETIDFCTSKTCEGLLGEAVADLLAYGNEMSALSLGI